MTGTFRTQDARIRAEIEGRARRIVENVAAAYGATGTLDVIWGYPAVVNDAELARTFRSYMASETDVPVLEPPATMGGEDFAYFAERAPGLLIRHGIRNEAKGSIHPGHSPQFRLDEDALAYGIATLVAFARGVGSGAVTGGSEGP